MKRYFNWFLYAVANGLNFKGRASRTEFWSFFGFFVLFGILLNTFLQGFIVAGQTNPTPQSSFANTLLGIYTIVGVVILAACFVRRLHDRDLSGWWSLTAIPLCYLEPGLILIYLIYAAFPSLGPNPYGEAAPTNPDQTAEEMFNGRILKKIENKISGMVHGDRSKKSPYVYTAGDSKKFTKIEENEPEATPQAPVDDVPMNAQPQERTRHVNSTGTADPAASDLVSKLKDISKKQ